MTSGRKYAATMAALLFFALALRLAYAWRCGVTPPAAPLAAALVTVALAAALAHRLAGPAATAAAAFFAAALPAHVVASVWYPDDVYATTAAACSLYFYVRREGRPARAADAAWAGVFVAVAAAFRSSALVLAAFYVLDGLVTAVRGKGEARRWAWLAGFGAVAAAAAALEYYRAGFWFASVRAILATPPPVYPEAKFVVRRLFADAAATAFWDPLGFGALITLAAAATAFLWRRPAARFYAALALTLVAVFNFAPATLGVYAPARLEPRRWLLAAIPAGILAAAAGGELWNGRAAEPLGRWAAALGFAFIAGALWTSGNMPAAPANFLLTALAVAATLALAGWVRRRPERAPSAARAAATFIFGLTLFHVSILYW
jgi:hypothetical protein